MIATSGFIRRKATDAGRWLHYAPALGPLAQLVEQGTLNPKVAGSIPARPTASQSSARGADRWKGSGETGRFPRLVCTALLVRSRRAHAARARGRVLLGARRRGAAPTGDDRVPSPLPPSSGALARTARPPDRLAADRTAGKAVPARRQPSSARL